MEKPKLHVVKMAHPDRQRSLTEQLGLVKPPGFAPRLAQPASVAAMAGAAQRRKISTRPQPLPLWQNLSSDLCFDVYFHLPGRSALGKLSVHRSQSLMCMQAALQRHFGVPFEQQRLFFHDEQLEGDDEVIDYGLQDKSVVTVRISPRFRRIGDVFSTIRTIRFPSPSSKLEDYQIVEIPAKLPPLRVVLQRIIHAITYLTILDRKQEQRTHRRVWRQHASFWDSQTPTAPSNSDDTRPSSYVLQASSSDHVSTLLALAKTHGVQSRLHRPPAHRSSADLRNLKKWFASLKYFADAQLPDSIFQELARTSTYMRVKCGDFVFRQGETGDRFYVLITGCVSLAAYSTGFFRTLTPGSCFGEISLIEPQGLRTASACATFCTAWTELAVVSGDLYRRAIKPYKQVVLRATEKAIASIPRLHALPPHIITHLAYAAKSLTARQGRQIISRGEEITVLVLLIQGSVKVSKPNDKPIVAVVQAPAIFGQEGALATTASLAPWDIIALDTCSLLCVRKDTIASFLSPLQDVVRALMNEHFQRLREFTQRFHIDRELAHQSSATDHHGPVSPSKHSRNKSIVFPHLLTIVSTEDHHRPVNDRPQEPRPVQKSKPSS
ncbi:hypothetical protein L914_08733 [Phytophthora nicotianae]|uniref:Cyclic nucleotide-binding domain-containing protein n=2 Tax=Phytophthora nicotianae TaxID=4792 RepID=V9F666_PHYNI|nr:hypothetical protein F443_09040 [Phytophthora nicotianae P1569]ETM46352.1 hypothetical protein L914_08733 [Phytophthora nicotianae]